MTQSPNAWPEEKEIKGPLILQSMLKEKQQGPPLTRKDKIAIENDGVMRRRTFMTDPDYADYRYYARINLTGGKVPPFVPRKDADINRVGASITSDWVAAQRSADVRLRTEEKFRNLRAGRTQTSNLTPQGKRKSVNRSETENSPKESHHQRLSRWT